MNDLDDKPLPLSHLRTPVPLNEFDYAAVRSRVHAKLARQSPWPLFRFASAFAGVVLGVLALIPKEPARAPVGVLRASGPRVLGSSGLTPEKPSMPPRNREPEEPRIATIRHRAKFRRPRPAPDVAVAAASRIEIHTADPDIRIIWIVPKENS